MNFLLELKNGYISYITYIKSILPELKKSKMNLYTLNRISWDLRLI